MLCVHTQHTFQAEQCVLSHDSILTTFEYQTTLQLRDSISESRHQDNFVCL